MSFSILATLLIASLGAPSTDIALAQPCSSTGSTFDIREYGSTAGEDKVNTESIQKAIDACTASGGGVVLVSGGRFVTGTIYLKDNVTLYIDQGSALLGSTDVADYATDTHKNLYDGESHMDRCLIFAQNARNIAIEGRGVIDGQGSKENFPTDGSPRPMMFRFFECRHLRIRDVNLVNPVSWTSAWLYCEDIFVAGIRIESRSNWNGDGLDFDGCRNVRVIGCYFDTSDDSICLQASRADKPCENVTISDCIFISKWAAIRIGMLSVGDFENVAVTNCIFRDISDAGLKIQMCEGGVMNNMVFSNLVMQNVPRPVFMTFSQWRMCVDTPQGTPPIKSMGYMQFNNISVDNSKLAGVPCGIVLSGVPGHYIEDITFHNVSLRLPGGETADNEVIEELPTFVDVRPEFHVLGDRIPFSGFYARQVRRLRLSGVRFETVQPDDRPVVICSDVDGLTIQGIEYNGPFTNTEKIYLLTDKNTKFSDISNIKI